MTHIQACKNCGGKGRLRVKRRGFIRRYYVKCHDCKAETIQIRTPEQAISLWNDSWIFGWNLTVAYLDRVMDRDEEFLRACHEELQQKV